MQPNRVLAALFLLSFALFAGCGGNTNSVVPPPPGQSSPVSVTMADNPPAGVDMFAVEVNLTGAILNSGAVDLLAGKGPVEIEVKRLEVETAFLSTATVKAGTYTSLTLTFANPELTFRNGTTMVLAGCNPGAVCEIKPTGTLTTTFNFPSPGLIIGNNTPMGLQIDLNLTNLITSTLGVDFSANGAVSVTQSQPKPEGELEDVDEVSGVVQNKGASTFDLKTSQGTILSAIQTDSNTRFDDFTCPSPRTFSACVQNGQMVEADLKMLAGGALLAKKISQENEEDKEEDIEGIVFSINAPAGSFQMVAVENLSSLASSTLLGSPINVKLQSGAQFGVDTHGLNVNSGLVSSFSGAGAMIVGQNVQVRRVSGDGSTATPIVTDRVRLESSRFTAKVKAKIDANTFTVDTTTIGLFNSAGITQITVDASQAKFEPNGLTVNSLNVGDSVSVRGLLFKQPANPLLVAGKIRKH